MYRRFGPWVPLISIEVSIINPRRFPKKPSWEGCFLLNDIIKAKIAKATKEKRLYSTPREISCLCSSTQGLVYSEWMLNLGCLIKKMSKKTITNEKDKTKDFITKRLTLSTLDSATTKSFKSGPTNRKTIKRAVRKENTVALVLSSSENCSSEKELLERKNMPMTADENPKMIRTLSLIENAMNNYKSER